MRALNENRLFLILALLGATGSSAQEGSVPLAGLTVDQAVTEAVGHSPQLKRAQAAYQESTWKPLEALSANLPKITLNANHLLGVKYQVIDVNFGPNPVSIETIYPKTQITLGAQWTLFDGLQTPHAYRAAKLGEEASQLELTRTQLMIEGDIHLKFYQAIAAQQLAAVAEQNVLTLEDHLKKAKSILAQGGSTRFDLLRIQVQLEEAGPEREQAADHVILAREALAQSMGLEKDPRSLVGTLPVPDEKRIPSGIKIQSAERDDVQALVKRAEAADQVHSAAGGFWYPRVSLSAEKNFYNNRDSSLTDNYRDAYSVGVLLSWNLFDGGASFARQKEAALQREQVESAATAAALRAPNELEYWRRKYLFNVSLYHARRRAIETAQESVRLAGLGIEAGTRTSSDVLDSELDLFRARAGLVRAQLEGAEAFLNLTLALGRKI